MGLNGTLVEADALMGHFNVHILASTSVPFRLTTVLTPNLALIETKQIAVWYSYRITGFLAVVRFGS